MVEFGNSKALESLLSSEDGLSSFQPHFDSQSAFGLEQPLQRRVGASFAQDNYLNQFFTAITPSEQVLSNLQLSSGLEMYAHVPSLTNSSIAAAKDLLTGVVGINPLVANQGDKLLWSGTSDSKARQATGEIVFIDSGIQDYQSLIAGIKPGTEVAVLDSVRNQVEQIGQYLANRSGISSIHIVSHGGSGSLQLGETKLGLDTLNNYTNELQQWGRALKSGGDILLYGCDVAEGEQGAAFVQQLSRLTGADIAASTDLTGSAALGGDWTLEFSTGSIKSSQAFQPGALETYHSTLTIGPDGSGYVAVSTSFQSSLNLVPESSDVVTISALSSIDDSPTAAIDLGTNTFTFYGQTYTGNSQLFVSANGLITFGSGNSGYINDDLTSTLSQTAIAPAWDDWVTNVGGTPDDLVLYQFQDLNNDSTSDQLVIEWNNVHNFSNRTAGDATFQTILNLNTGSTNGNIIFNYSDLSIPNTNLDEAGSATVGIKDAGTQGFNRLLISQNTTASPYVGTGRAVLVTNHTPLLDLNGDQTKDAIGIDHSTSFAQGGGAVSIVNSTNLSLVAPGSSTLASATVTITNLLDGASEVLTADTAGTSITAVYNSTTGALTLTGSDTVANYQQVLRSITYNNMAASPNSSDRSITFVVSDGTNTSPIATSTVGINAPLLDLNGTATGINYIGLFARGVAVAAVDNANLALSDPDSPNLSSATVEITNLRNGVSEVLAANTTGTNIIADYSSTTGVLTLSGLDTIANYQQVLRSITYNNTAENPDTRDRLINFTVSDATKNSPIATTTLTFNNPSTISAVVDQTINEDNSSETISFTIGDAETAADALTVTALSSDQTLISNNNLALGDSGSNRTIMITPAANQSGTATLTLRVSDGVNTTDRTFSLTVNPVNDIPIANSDALTTLRAQPITLNRANLLANDTDVDGGSLSISGFTQTSNGTLVDNGDGTFTYTPDIYFDSTDSFTYTISDGQGGTANGQVNLTVKTEDGIFNLVQASQFFNIGNLNARSLFDERFYLAQNPDVAQSVARGTFRSGFEHFGRFGQAEDRDPSLLFNNKLYLAQNPDVQQATTAGAFQSGFDHFIRFGHNERRDLRSLNFDEGFYLEHNRDVAQAVAARTFRSGYEHFLRFGQAEGRNPSVLFDNNFYLAHNSDVAQAVAARTFRSGYEHFLRFGIFEGRNPSHLFDNSRYLAENLDAAQAVAAKAFRSGFDHFLRLGQFEGRQPKLELFNENFYLANNSDVARAVAAKAFKSGFEHFIRFGQAERRNPSVLFDEDFYLANNSDVARAVAAKAFKSGFEHFIHFGRAEGRSAVG